MAQRDAVPNQAWLAGADFGVFCEGDLEVTDGAFRGNIGPNDGAPFPRPAYDSGWVSIAVGESSTRTHGLGGDVDDYFVDLSFKDEDGVVHKRSMGGDSFHNLNNDYVHIGGEIRELTTQTIEVYRNLNDFNIRQYRVRIWVIK